MQILDNLIIILLHVACFIAGIKLANYYNEKAIREQKDALQKQYVRLAARSDADDPCQPYMTPDGPCKPYGTPDYYPENPDCYPTGNTGGDNQPITPEFMDELRQNGRAKVSFRKSDVS